MGEPEPGRRDWGVDGLRALGRIAVAASLALLSAAPTARAGTPVPYGGEFRAEIERAFFERTGPPGDDPAPVSAEKLAAHRAFILEKRRFAIEHVTRSQRIDRGAGADRAAKKARRSDTVVALDHILELLDLLARASDPGEAYRIAAEIFMVEYATRSFSNPIASLKIPVHLKNMVLDWSLPDATRARGAAREAGNLVDEEHGGFHTARELEAMIRAGRDISRLDPPRETPFWRRPDDIASVDVVAHYLGGRDPVNEGLELVYPPPDGAVFVLERAHKTQSKPKLDVRLLDARCASAKCRPRMKLKFGMETHADPVANALLSTLGFNVDISVHVKNVRVYLGKHSLDELERDWAGYFDRQRLHTYFPLDTVLLEGGRGRGRDERGEYLVFQEAVAELKPPGIDRIGMFSFSRGLATQAREARALFLFNVWIANADMKDEENNKVSLRQDAGGRRRMLLTQHDLGHALGLVLPERPGAFPWDVVETDALSRLFGRARGRMELTYVDLQDTGLEETTTFADARWMARLIAQLTRGQIEAAVRLGVWPPGVGELYVEKLIHRRNQLVEAFAIGDEFEPIPVDRHLTTADGSVVDGRLVRNRWKGSPINFGRHWRDVFGPVGRFFEDAGKALLQVGAGAIDVIDTGRIRISGKLGVHPEVLVQLTRSVRLNPDPQGSFDQYIVEDAFGLGLRVGVGWVGRAEGALFRSWRIAYPAPSRRVALGSGHRILSHLLPVDVRTGNLPEKYVLYREDSVARGVRVSSDDAGSHLSPLGLEASLNRVVAQRSVIDRRGEAPVVWIDRPDFIDRDVRALLQLAVLEIPFATGSLANGSIAGRAWTLDPARLAAVGDDGEPILDAMTRRGDFAEIARLAAGEPREVSTEFRSREGWWTLFFATSRSRAREDRVSVPALAGRPDRVEFQVERGKRSSWTFVDNGESQEIAVTGFLGAIDARGDAVEGPVLVATWEVDDLNAHNDELDGYYRFLSGLDPQREHMPGGFAAADWEVSGRPGGRWNRLLARATLHTRGEAVERLAGLREDRYWPRLAEQLGVDEARLLRLREEIASPNLHVRRRALLSGPGRRHRPAVLRSQRVLGALRKAREATGAEQRLRHLVDAVYLANFRRGHTFDPAVMAALLAEARSGAAPDDGGMFLEGRITKAFEDELNLPERSDIVGRVGEPTDFRAVRWRFLPQDGIELYHMLDWVREIE